ncbi:MAG TPA: acetyl-CoA hydrolase/transferase C-terminal domain-containing protein [Methanothrix sp.]|nr:acetyl-CoA hydrolase/transferase C-terminal domain-containing protein [Methanothrix sp.]
MSRIVPSLLPGSGVTLTRSDVQYVVTERRIAYLQGKNIRERAMDLISITHLDFRSWLIEEAKRQDLIYQDQNYVPGRWCSSPPSRTKPSRRRRRSSASASTASTATCTPPRWPWW